MGKPILRPLTIPELLDNVLQLYKRHAFLLLMICAIILIPSAIIRSVSLIYLDDSRLVDIVLNVFLSPFAELATVVAISSLYLGNEPTIQESFSKGAKRFWPRFRALFLVGLAMIPAGLLIFLSSLGGAVLSLIAIALFVPLVLFLSTRWSLVESIVVLEYIGAGKSLERSWALTDGYFWRVFGTSFAARLLSLLLSTLPSVLITFLLGQMMDVPPKLTLIITAVVEQLTSIIIYPLILGVNVLIYYDLRIRKEGFDLMFMSDESLEL